MEVPIFIESFAVSGIFYVAKYGKLRGFIPSAQTKKEQVGLI